MSSVPELLLGAELQLLRGTTLSSQAIMAAWAGGGSGRGSRRGGRKASLVHVVMLGKEPGGCSRDHAL